MATQLLVWCQLIGALAYIFGFSNPHADQHVKAQAARQAWETLRPCANTTSLDGNWTLSLAENGRAEVDNRKDEQKLQGHWDLIDAAQLVYRIDVLAFGNDFTVVPSVTGCVLASGTLRSADLSLSWFSRREQDGAEPIASVSNARIATK
jgi:hypothetical protein